MLCVGPSEFGPHLALVYEDRQSELWLVSDVYQHRWVVKYFKSPRRQTWILLNVNDVKPHQNIFSCPKCSIIDLMTCSCEMHDWSNFSGAVDSVMPSYHVCNIRVTRLFTGDPSVNGSSPHIGSVIRSVFFSLILNKRLKLQATCRWFTTPWGSCGIAFVQKWLLLLYTNFAESRWCCISNTNLVKML